MSGEQMQTCSTHLIDLTFPWEQRLSVTQLPEDTPHRPHVHRLPVRRPVASGTHTEQQSLTQHLGRSRAMTMKVMVMMTDAGGGRSWGLVRKEGGLAAEKHRWCWRQRVSEGAQRSLWACRDIPPALTNVILLPGSEAFLRGGGEKKQNPFTFKDKPMNTDTKCLLSTATSEGLRPPDRRTALALLSLHVSSWRW